MTSYESQKGKDCKENGAKLNTNSYLYLVLYLNEEIFQGYELSYIELYLAFVY